VRIFAFIPARYGSSRFPGKPLALISGKPMIRRVWERAVLCPEFADVIVATDDERILSSVRAFGARAVMTEPSHRSGTDRICEAAERMGVGAEDIVVNIQGDQPLLEPGVISDLVGPHLTDPSVYATTLKWRIRERGDLSNPNHVKVVTDKQGFALYFSRHPIPYCRGEDRENIHFKHLGLYAYKMGFLAEYTRMPQGALESAEKLEQLRILEHGYRIKVVETRFNSMEVDVPEDIRLVEQLLKGPWTSGAA
jgi:3-deoxy-manno-octulosonate cytidylyltransferase (CMP-KDO synthetase)